MCSNSQKKMAITATTNLPFQKGAYKNGKRWVRVKFHSSGQEWIPSFEDLHRVIQAISHCEQEKYPNGQGRDMVAQFLYECVYNPDFSVLARAYNIPYRCGTKIVDDNGANVREVNQ